VLKLLGKATSDSGVDADGLLDEAVDVLLFE
jgi:hypothetical protein